jgi:hypothetical protein
MIITSVEVIQMSKESKWEDIPREFEVSNITTDYLKWSDNMFDHILSYTETDCVPEIDNFCLEFAKKHQAYMLAPTAKFGHLFYLSESKVVDTLDNVIIDGPLYRVYAFMKDDTSAEKTEERKYIDPVSFAPRYGLWYPQKKMYKIRYGYIANG